jgi:integrase
MKTLNDLFVIYKKDLARRKCKTITKIEQTYNNNIKETLGDRDISTIIRGDIATLHFDISDRAPYTANSCLTMLKSMFNLAITLSYVESNPATHIGKNRENKRKRYLTNAELLRITEVLNELKDKPQYKKSVTFIWLLILTGARKGEIGNAKWSDLHGNALVIKDHKTDKLGEDRVIYLAPMAMEIISGCARGVGEYIVGIKTPRRAWEKIKQLAGLEDVCLHDIRHSYASWSLQKVSLAEVGGLLGHRDQATTQRYAHIHQDKAIENANLVGNHIESIINSRTL